MTNHDLLGAKEVVMATEGNSQREVGQFWEALVTLNLVMMGGHQNQAGGLGAETGLRSWHTWRLPGRMSGAGTGPLEGGAALTGCVGKALGWRKRTGNLVRDAHYILARMSTGGSWQDLSSELRRASFLMLTQLWDTPGASHQEVLHQ